MIKTGWDARALAGGYEAWRERYDVQLRDEAAS